MKMERSNTKQVRRAFSALVQDFFDTKWVSQNKWVSGSYLYKYESV